jgi:cytochrome c
MAASARLRSRPTDRDPQKLIGNYWPYATTIFDYTRRAMPWHQPKTLTDDEVYSLTAYILALNKIIGEDDVINAETLPTVNMPNRDGFISKYPDKH